MQEDEPAIESKSHRRWSAIDIFNQPPCLTHQRVVAHSVCELGIVISSRADHLIFEKARRISNHLYCEADHGQHHQPLPKE